MCSMAFIERNFKRNPTKHALADGSAHLQHNGASINGRAPWGAVAGLRVACQMQNFTILTRNQRVPMVFE